MEVKETYTLTEVAALFHQLPLTIRRRCAQGDFDYEVGPGGRYKITRESILRHMEELEMKNYE